MKDQAKKPLRVAYVWSQELQDVSDDLPSNVGRSSLVHGLVRALDLVEDAPGTEEGARYDKAAEDDEVLGEGEDGDNDVDDDGDSNAHNAESSDGPAEGTRAKKVEHEEAAASEDASNVSEKQTGRVTEHPQRQRRSSAKPNGHDIGRATIVPPDESLGTKECLTKYHDRAYVEALLKHRGRSTPTNDPTAPPSPPSSGSSDSNPNSNSSPSPSPPRPSKRRRTDTHKKPGQCEARRHTFPQTDPFNLSHDNPPFRTLPRYIGLLAAATSTACRLLVRDRADAVCVWDGGRHHARRKEAGGFCYVNDLVLGCLLLSREGRVPMPVPVPVPVLPSEHQKAGSVGKVKTRPPRIMYLDLDLHYSDGVSSAFQSPTQYPYYPTTPGEKDEMTTKMKPPKPPSVLTLSVHHSSPVFFPPPTPASLLPSPDTPNPFSLSVPLAAYPSIGTYKAVWDRCVEPIRTAWDPDYVVLQLGADGLPGDRVGQYGNWATQGEGGMHWCVHRVKGWGTKLCVTGGGGYHHPNAARAWAGVTAALLDGDLEPDTSIPHHDHFEAYEPSFTMEIPQGHMRDENTPEELDRAGEVYGVIAQRIREIVAAHS